MSRAFSDAAQKEIAEIRERFPTAEAATLPLLYLAQREHGVVDQETVSLVAATLGTPEIKVREVATWYTMYHKQPVGRHHVEVCTNLACHLCGGAELLDSLCQEVGVEPGGTSSDGRVTLDEVECLGSCGTAPAMQIDGEFYENLTPEQAGEAIRKLD